MFQPSDIALLTLDLDDTLWPCQPVILAAEQALHAWLEDKAPRLARAHDMHSMRAHRQRLSLDRPEIAHDITELRRQSLRELLEQHRYRSALAWEAMEVFLETRNRVEPYAEVPGVLRRLANRFTLVATTNGNADVERTPLRGLFHHAISAAQAGASKPAPDLFLKALDWAGVEPARALHLGDDPELDIAPARALGMATVWVNRSGRAWPFGEQPADLEVNNLEPLLARFGI